MTTLQTTQAKKTGIAIAFGMKQAMRVFDALSAEGLCPAYRERQIASNGGKAVTGITIEALARMFEANAPFRSAIASVTGASAAFKRIAATRGSVDFGPLTEDGTYELRTAPKPKEAA